MILHYFTLDLTRQLPQLRDSLPWVYLQVTWCNPVYFGCSLSRQWTNQNHHNRRPWCSNMPGITLDGMFHTSRDICSFIHKRMITQWNTTCFPGWCGLLVIIICLVCVGVNPLRTGSPWPCVDFDDWIPYCGFKYKYYLHLGSYIRTKIMTSRVQQTQHFPWVPDCTGRRRMKIRHYSP